MAIPLLAYAPKTQNARVDGFDVANDDQARIFSTENLLSDTDLDALIEAAYRQIIFHAFKADREPFLESQLRNGQITVREFIRGLCLANTFTQSFYNLNSNYKFVEHCVNRLLGREIAGEGEKLAWSIVVATKGRAGLVNDLLDSDEYLDNFGDHTVPYQRRRVLASSNTANVPFNIENPRYDAYMRRKLGFPKYVFSGTATVKSFKKSGDDKFQAGSPANFLEMARGISMGGGGPISNAYDVDFIDGVPYRKTN